MRSNVSRAPSRAAVSRRFADGLISMAGRRKVLAPLDFQQPAQRHRLLLGAGDQNADAAAGPTSRSDGAQPLQQRARARGQHALGQQRSQSDRMTRGLPDWLSRSSREPSGSATRPSSSQGVALESAHAPRSAIGSCRPAGGRTRAPHPWRYEWRRARAARQQLQGTLVGAAALDADHALTLRPAGRPWDRGVRRCAIPVRGGSSPRRPARWRPIRRHRSAAAAYPHCRATARCADPAAPPVTVPGAAGSRCPRAHRAADQPSARRSRRPARHGGRRARAPRRSAIHAGRSPGTSFIECTAMSARCSSSATSSSLMNRPLPPIAASGRSWMRSPWVTMGTSSTSRPLCAWRSRVATCSACHSASWLLRVAMRSGEHPCRLRLRAVGNSADFSR